MAPAVPGPGLAIRIIGAVTRERLAILHDADSILQEEVRRAGLYRELWQSFAVLPAIRSVGVQGDERTYGYPVVIRAVTSDDAMTADWARLPYDLIELISIADRQRDPGREPRRPRRDVEAARHHRVGVAGLDHVVIAVSDWERSNAFYRDVLGAEVLELELWAVRVSVCRTGGS